MVQTTYSRRRGMPVQGLPDDHPIQQQAISTPANGMQNPPRVVQALQNVGGGLLRGTASGMASVVNTPGRFVNWATGKDTVPMVSEDFSQVDIPGIGKGTYKPAEIVGELAPAVVTGRGAGVALEKGAAKVASEAGALSSEANGVGRAASVAEKGANQFGKVARPVAHVTTATGVAPTVAGTALDTIKENADPIAPLASQPTQEEQPANGEPVSVTAHPNIEGGQLSTANKETDGVGQETAGLIEAGNDYQERYHGSDKYTRSAGDALLNYAIGYFANGGDIKKGLALGLKAGANTFINKSMREGDEVTKEMKKLKFSNAQIQQYVESGKLSERPANLVAEQLAASNNLIKSKIDSVTGKGGKSKQLSDAAQKAATGLAQMDSANLAFQGLDKANGGSYEDTLGGLVSQGFQNVLPSGLQSKEYRQYQQGSAKWIEGALRRLSGATIKDEEREAYAKMYFAQPGDTPEEIVSKRASRHILETATALGAGQLDSSTTRQLIDIIGSGQYRDSRKVNNEDGSTTLYLLSLDGKTETPVRIPQA